MSEKWTIKAEYDVIQEVGNKQRYRKRRMRKAKNMSESGGILDKLRMGRQTGGSWRPLHRHILSAFLFNTFFTSNSQLPSPHLHPISQCCELWFHSCHHLWVLYICVLIVLSSDSPWSHPSCNPCKDLDTPHLSSHQESPIFSVPDTFSVLWDFKSKLLKIYPMKAIYI